MTSSMSIRDKAEERRCKMRERLKEQKEKDQGRKGVIDLVTWRDGPQMPGTIRGLQAEESSETLAMRNGPQVSIHQLLVLLDHLYL